MKKIILSTLLIALGITLFLIPKGEQVTIETQEENVKRIVKKNETGFQKLCEWLGVILLALSIWIWRGELGITSVGPFGGPPLEQMGSKKIIKKKKEEERERREICKFNVSAFRKRYIPVETTELLNIEKAIVNYVKKKHAVNTMEVAHHFNKTRVTAYDILLRLVAKKELRRDKFKRHSVFTYAKSLENLALDYALKYLKEKNYKMIEEHRFMRIGNRYEVDGYIESEDIYFLLEVKILLENINLSLLRKWTSMALATMEYFEQKPIEFIFILVSPTASAKQKALNKLNKYGDKNIYNIRYILLSKQELI